LRPVLLLIQNMETPYKRSGHIWNFSRIGGNDRVRIESGKDLASLSELDQKLWTALSCPVEGLDFDKKTLELLDEDTDGKIRAPELIATVDWLLSVVKNPDDLIAPKPEMPLSVIDEHKPLGKQLFDSAKQVLINLGKPDAQSISVDDTSDTIKIFAHTKFNGDGVVTSEATDDTDLQTIIELIVKHIGYVNDRCGKPGVNKELTEKFYANCNDFCAWVEKSHVNPDQILPFGEDTAPANSVVSALKPKIDDYFIRSRFVTFDSGSEIALNSQISAFAATAPKNFASRLEELSELPLAHIGSKLDLNLVRGINPAWEDFVQKFLNLVVIPTFGAAKTSISEAEWNQIETKFTAYNTWISEKKGDAVEAIGYDEAKRIATENRLSEIIALIDFDLTFADEADSIISVDKLVRYYSNFYKLVTNYVTFIDFYTPDKHAIFQVGTLYIDQRSCDFCLKVIDPAKHAAMAHLSGMYLMYCDCTSKKNGEKMSIVAAITDGDVDNLMVGRNGLFYDRKGQDWDATVTKIVENPISIRQAFFSPYKKFVRMIEDQVHKFAANKEKSLEASASSKIAKSSEELTAEKKVEDGTAAADATADSKAKETKVPFDIGKFAGIFAAIGLAIGAIGSMLGAVVAGFLGLAWWKMPLAFLGVILLISGPSMLLAWMKLRKRNLAPILDANGWAVNAKSLINTRFGATLTHIAHLPKNSKRSLKDPFARKKVPTWLRITILAVLVAGAVSIWYFDYWLVIQSWFDSPPTLKTE